MYCLICIYYQLLKRKGVRSRVDPEILCTPFLVLMLNAMHKFTVKEGKKGIKKGHKNASVRKSSKTGCREETLIFSESLPLYHEFLGFNHENLDLN